MTNGMDYFTFPIKRDLDVEAEWEAQSLFEEMLQEDWDTAGEADLPLELEAYEVLAAADPDFDSSWCDWMAFACETGILLPIEQSCENGVLLLTEQRALRLATCPEDMLKPLRRFFESGPSHVKLLLCHYIYWLVRIERGRRTGAGHWRPRRPRKATSSQTSPPTS